MVWLSFKVIGSHVQCACRCMSCLRVSHKLPVSDSQVTRESTTVWFTIHYSMPQFELNIVYACFNFSSTPFSYYLLCMHVRMWMCVYNDIWLIRNGSDMTNIELMAFTASPLCISKHHDTI